MKKTKIVCTLGSASGSEAVLKKMLLAGMNVARFNFSHGTHESHKKMIDIVKRGDRVVITSGEMVRSSGNTNLLKVEIVQ